MKFDNPYNIFLDDKAFELGTLYDNNYKGSSTKKGNNHRKVRIRAIKRGATIVEGNVIETKSKYPINVFENESSKKVSK